MKRITKLLRIISVLVVFSAIVFGFTKCNLFFVDSTIHPEKPPLFQVGDTLIFKSSANVDSFFVETAKLYQVNEDDGCVSDYLDRQRYFSLIKQINCNNDSCYMFASTILPGEYFVTALSLGSGFKDPIYPGGILLGGGSGGRELKVGKYIIKGISELTYPLDSVCKKNVYSFLYSKKYGLVQYKLFNNEVFLITEESLEMLMERD
ncbi:MAG TPA: hypothetical protein PLS94_14120 [Prolixibacteraceae bacterium]|nr:hypothetical protein [Prolixibacteraceae bacterium]